MTGIDAGDFSRFTVDRLMTVVNRLGFSIDVSVKFRRTPAQTWEHGIPAD